MGKASAAATLEKDRAEDIDTEVLEASDTQQNEPAGWELRKAEATLRTNSRGFAGGLTLELHRDAIDGVTHVNEGLVPELLHEIRQSAEYKRFAVLLAIVNENEAELREIRADKDGLSKLIAEHQASLADEASSDKLRSAFAQKSDCESHEAMVLQSLATVKEEYNAARAQLHELCCKASPAFKERVLRQRQESISEAKEAMIEAIKHHLDRLFASTRGVQQLAKWSIAGEDLVQRLETPQS